MDKKQKNTENKRHLFQGFWALITNSYILGFMRGKIYQGKIKGLCVPGLNCYSCPGAVASCPIGSLQGVLGSHQFIMSFYVAGLMILIGALIGRFLCGFLCPFGLIQDLLHKIPLLKILKISTFRGDKLLRKMKYVILAVFVVILPSVIVDVIGQGTPWFCKLICPVGTLEAGLPLIAMNQKFHSTLGGLFYLKVAILIATLLLCVIIYRPFCKYVCPLGAIYSMFNPISALKYEVDKEKCNSCGACAKVCKMNCDPTKNSNDPECIRCASCVNICKQQAINYTIFSKQLKEKKMKKFLIINLMLLSTMLFTACSNNKTYEPPIKGVDNEIINQEEPDYISGIDEELKKTPMGAFTAFDFDKNEQKEDVFSEYDLTLVNLWTTTCGYCIKEMPDLEELKNKYQNNGISFNIVAFCLDMGNTGKIDDKKLATAKEIIAKTGVTYPNLIPDQNLLDGRLKDIQAFPESFFVDSEGNIVGHTIIGANSKNHWKILINNALERQKGDK